MTATPADLQLLIRDKSRALLRANAMERAGEVALSAKVFADVAIIEEAIAQKLRGLGNSDWYINAISAASCWAKARDFGRARENLCIVLREEPKRDFNEELLWFLSNPQVERLLSLSASEPSSLPVRSLTLPTVIPRVHLLSIGIDYYSDDRIPSLEFAARDAEYIRDAWSSFSVGGLVACLIDRFATRESIGRELRTLQQTARPEDHILVHFCGHGFTARSGKRYFVTSDTDLDHPEKSAISVSELNLAFKAMSARQKILIFDSSFSGRGEKVDLDYRQRTRKSVESIWKGFVDCGVAVLAACHSGQTALESTQLRHGLMSNYLLEWLTSTQDRLSTTLSLRALHKYVVEMVCDRAQLEFGRDQRPFLQAQLADDVVPTKLGASFERWRSELRRQEAELEVAGVLSQPRVKEEDLREILVRHQESFADDPYSHVVVSPILVSDESRQLAPDLILAGGPSGRTLLVGIVSMQGGIDPTLVRGRAKLLEACRRYLQIQSNREVFEYHYRVPIGEIGLTMIVPGEPKTPLKGVRVLTYSDILQRMRQPILALPAPVETNDDT